MKELRIEKQIEMAKQKIKLKLWSVDYAKGYCYALLNEDLNNGIITNNEYNIYADRIDNLIDNLVTITTASSSDKYKQIISQLSIEEQDTIIAYNTGTTREDLQKNHDYTDEQINHIILTGIFKRDMEEFCKKREEEREKRRKG